MNDPQLNALIAAGASGAIASVIATACLVTWIGIAPGNAHLDYVYFVAAVAGAVLGVTAALLLQDPPRCP